MEHNYIICIYDNDYEIMGPFSSRADLVAAGERWQAMNGDRPTWQSVYLADPHAAPRVMQPGT